MLISFQRFQRPDVMWSGTPLISFPTSLSFTHCTPTTGHLGEPGTLQAHAHLRVFILADPSAQNALPPNPILLHSECIHFFKIFTQKLCSQGVCLDLPIWELAFSQHS